MRQKIIFNIVIASILAAMALVLEKLGIKIPLLGNTTTLRISFYGLPLMIAGIIFGYKTGLLAGLIMAIISQLVLSEYGITPTTPLWMIAPIIFGLLSGLIIKIFKDKISVISILISVVITSIFVSLANSLALYVDGIVFDYDTKITFVLIMIRILSSIVVACIYIPILYILSKRLKKFIEE